MLYFILNHLFSTKSILSIFFRIFFHRNILYICGIKHACTYTRKHENSAYMHQCQCTDTHFRMWSFKRVHAHVYAFFAATIGSDFCGGDKEGFTVGRDVATIPLGFALCESEWKPVSQLGEQARACSVREELYYEHV